MRANQSIRTNWHNFGRNVSLCAMNGMMGCSPLMFPGCVGRMRGCRPDKAHRNHSIFSRVVQKSQPYSGKDRFRIQNSEIQFIWEQITCNVRKC